MLAAKYRFHGYSALKFVFGRGRTYRFKSFSLRVAANPRRTNSRATVVVSKKVLKASPKRNQVRRRVYEALRLQWDAIAPGHDILISIYDPNFLEMTHVELVDELKKAFQTANIWHEASPPAKTPS